MGTLNNRCRILLRTQKGTIISTTTHMYLVMSTTPVLYGPVGEFTSNSGFLKLVVRKNRTGPVLLIGSKDYTSK